MPGRPSCSGAACSSRCFAHSPGCPSRPRFRAPSSPRGGHEPAEDYLSFYPVPSFYYLTGITEPRAALVLVKRGGTATMTLRAAVQRYANIGVRIEDDYFATSSGVEWISRGPRESSKIEQLMRARAPVLAPHDSSVIDWYRQTAPKP